MENEVENENKIFHFISFCILNNKYWYSTFDK